MKQRKRLEKHFYGNSKFGKLTVITAFWKNDKPYGLGYSVPINDENTCSRFADIFEAYTKHYEDADAADRSSQISEYKEQLDNHKEWLHDNPGFEICLIANVWFLESIGLIDADNFNGMMAVWQ